MADLVKLQKRIPDEDAACLEFVSGAILKVKKRNKLIRIADKFPADRKTVREYESDGLASDSEDEKRIRSAGSRAIRGIKEKKIPHPYKTNRYSYCSYCFNFQSTSCSTKQLSTAALSDHQTEGTPSHDICYNCNQLGHWQTQCPLFSENQLSQGHQGNRVNDKYFYATFLDESNIYGQFELFLSHAKYFDNIDISSIAKGIKYCLRKHIQFWKHIGANDFVINTIKYCYVITFLQTPTSMSFKNNKSANVHSKFVDEAISELLNIGCYIETRFQPFVVNPLSVAVQSSGNKRLILDLSELNAFIKKKG
ncbi:unnamed protein product [Mytilus coruscus]|uniref:CCHC-type domain-containing protein n=1 Tax=Mytilus coruscus TaxID=42192 RepID=A0A6J8AAY4_MYTCO|nr:unnamed protein product [Mytilus coruscus]